MKLLILFSHHNYNHIIVNWNIQKEVSQYERKYRGRELPGFINYKTFEAMIQEQIKQLEEPAVQKLKDVSGMFFMIPQSLKVITEHVTLQVFFHFLIFYIDNFLFLELVKKELFELAQSSLVGFPNLIRTAMVTSPLLLVVYLLLNTDKYVLTSSV